MNDLETHLIRAPEHLEHLKWSDVSDLAATLPAEQPVILTWQAASIQIGGHNPDPVGDRSVISTAQLASSFRWKRLNQAAVAKARESSIRMMGISVGYEGLGESSKIRKPTDVPHQMRLCRIS